MNMEKRASSRYPTHIPVLIDGQIQGTVQNISADGVLVSTDQALTNGKTSKITFTFPRQNQTLETEGSLVRTTAADSLHLTAFYFISNIGIKLSQYIGNFSPNKIA